jgi:hypothetical protein
MMGIFPHVWAQYCGFAVLIERCLCFVIEAVEAQVLLSNQASQPYANHNENEEKQAYAYPYSVVPETYHEYEVQHHQTREADHPGKSAGAHE